MPLGLIGKKVGMTQLTDDGGTFIPVTVLQAGPCVVVDRRSTARDGYESIQLGLVEARPVKHATKAIQGHFKKSGVPPVRMLKEFPVQPGEEMQPGDRILVQSTFKPGDKVDITGVSKGKGFQGVMRRHNFRGGAASHGSMFHRAPGSVGASSYPSRVFPGTRMGGHMGARQVTMRNLVIVRIDEARNLLMVRGAVPGANGGYLTIRKAGS
jgi:large subunit ribosomal protein L3